MAHPTGLPPNGSTTNYVPPHNLSPRATMVWPPTWKMVTPTHFHTYFITNIGYAIFSGHFLDVRPFHSEFVFSSGCLRLEYSFSLLLGIHGFW